MSANSKVDDKGRRKLLIGAVAGIGAVGGGFAAVPFISSWMPSAKAKAAGAPITVDVSKLEKGSMLSGLKWRGKAVYVVNRSDEMLDAMVDDILSDPNSEKPQQPEFASNKFRSYEDKKNYLVLEGVCTHLGCAPKYKDKAVATVGMMQGGFYCPCHGSKFDFAGRVYAGVPAPTNLVVPPYYFKDDNTIVVGKLGEDA